jgi:hypothetical protein
MEEQEMMIAKIQLEYTTGTGIAIAQGQTNWDIGLLYLTNKNLWFVNREKQRTQVSLVNITNVGDIDKRTGGKTTKFTSVLKAFFNFNIEYNVDIDEETYILAVCIAAPQEVLGALRDQLVARTGVTTKKREGTLQLDKNQLLKRLSVLFHLNIQDQDKLEYFLGLGQEQFINLLLERNRLLQAV